MAAVGKDIAKMISAHLTNFANRLQPAWAASPADVSG
jgi:hypothetical protein